MLDAGRDIALRCPRPRMTNLQFEWAGHREAQPFLKWAGGKSQLLVQFDRFLPARVDRYYEPFVGGGALFFHLKHRFPRLQAFLRDNNEELINAYIAVRDFPHELMERLDAHLEEFRSDRTGYFYRIRRQHDLPAADIVARAARVIFLNKTCFNGLWRVNSRGQFNVPIGSGTRASLYDRENILAASAALRDADLAVHDFRDAMNEAGRGDFVYIDPPYVPLSRTASFTSYTTEGFGADEQQELAALFAKAAGRGARLMLSNSDTPAVRELYGKYQIHAVRARRAINRDGTKRGGIAELVVTNISKNI